MRAGGEIAYIAIGANMGDREDIFRRAIGALEAEADMLLHTASPVFETDPIGPAGQGAYLNAILEMRVWLSPRELLERLQATELALGRDRGSTAVRWGERTLDLDLIFFGERCIERPELTVPHPRAHLRAFVMRPMAALAPDFVHPVLGLTMDLILRELPEAQHEGIRPFDRPAGWPGSTRDFAEAHPRS